MSEEIAQAQLLLPLLEAYETAGGTAATRDIYETVASNLNVPQPLRSRRVPNGAYSVNHFERSVRWAQQRAKLEGLLEPLEKTHWRLTRRGREALTKSTPGLVVTLFTTAKGVALWASCEDAIGLVDDASASLIFTSPPYPLLREKAYGNVDERNYVDWFLRIAEQWPRKLTPDGSVVINLADVWHAGEPAISLYQERLLLRLQDELGLKLCQRFAWRNPGKLPAPAEWVTVRRVRVKPSVEQIFWLSTSAQPYADNRNVLVPYSDSMRQRIESGGDRAGHRPSGHVRRAGAFSVDNGGAIAEALITAPNTEANSNYIRACRENALPVHPARFPRALPEFFMKFLTRVDDLVIDPFGGSGTTARVAEDLGRRWIITDNVREYLEGARLRFQEPSGRG